MSKNIGYCFVKFTTSRFAEDLLDGNIFMNRRSYFAEIDDPEKRDEFEKYNFYYRSRIPDIEIDGDFIDKTTIYDFKGNFGGSENDPHIFCLSALYNDMLEFSEGKIFSERMRKY